MKQILAITRKELQSYFSSLLSIIFLGAFLAVVLFIFFNVEKFFARGIADIRPMFQWMPILLIFLIAALTMRQWSEEQRTGTLEVLLTLPTRPFQLVLGKFLAVVGIIVIALVLTLPLPITVSVLGNMDWGPVVGGYIAALLMASAYAAIGLFISSRTDNQIVALISTALVGGIFYFIGTRGITDLFGRTVSDILWGIGTGSRFESIERGVIDLRDLVYYLSLTGLFLVLNTISLDRIRWSIKQTSYRRNMILTSGLMAANLILVNVWVFPLQGLRVDLTAQKEYTISKTTHDLLDGLQEPLLIRAYISEKTHPLLAPLAPQISDMLQEYQIASHGMITTDVVDPITDPAIESEANQTYGIHATPFQITGTHETSVINSYFSILVRYGDQSVVLNFSDLIEVTQGTNGVEVRLKNLEYDLTRTIKKVVYGFQSVDAVLAALTEPVDLQFIVTPDTVPAEIASLVDTITTAATNIQETSKGKLKFEVINPDDPSATVTRQVLKDNYGIDPYSTDVYGTTTYYMHLVLINGQKAQMIYPTQDMTEADVRSEIEAALKRTSTGFLKVVGLWTPPSTPTTDMFGQTHNPISSYDLVTQFLSADYNVQTVDLTTGSVPPEIDVLVVVAPQNLTNVELYAIDQYLMRGGSVVMSASADKVDVDPYFGGLMMFPVEGGVKDLLASYGIMMSDAVVMDTQNEPFPVTVNRDVNGYQVQDIQSIPYPYFLDMRPATMDLKSPIMANLPTVTMHWASPIELDPNLNAGRQTDILMSSNSTSWLAPDVNIMPDLKTYPDLGFAPGVNPNSYPLAVSVVGSFKSYFAGQARPIAVTPTPSDPYAQSLQPTEIPTPEGATPEPAPVSTTIGQSPDTSRLVVIGSNFFVDDFVLNLSSRLSQDRYVNNLRFLQNAVDWAVEDQDLLAIRSRGTYTHLLNALTDQQQWFWEVLNYGIALLALIGIYVFWQLRKRNERPMQLLPVGKYGKE
jgi:ABC-2 type transport system permease protein